MATRDDVLSELSLLPRWTRRARAGLGAAAPCRRLRTAGCRRAGARSRCGRPRAARIGSAAPGAAVAGLDAAPRTPMSAPRRTAGAAPASPRSPGRTSPPTSPPAPPAGSAGRGSRRCPGSAPSRPTGCSSARRPGPTRTRRASRSSARRGGCSTTCSRRSVSPAARASTSPTCSSAGRPGNRTPEPPEVDACLPYLDRQIELLRPRLIVALGQERRHDAARHRRDDREPARPRSTATADVPLVVTYHPAYLLRNLPDKAKAWEDLLLARRTMAQLPAARAPEPDSGVAR